jgi:uncharacterized membrane protein
VESTKAPLFHPLDPRAAFGRLAVALTVAAVVVTMLTVFAHVTVIVAALAGWNASGITWLALAWLMTSDADADRTRSRAGSEDPGRRAGYAIVTLGSFVSLLAATLLSRHVRTVAAEGERTVLVTMCLAAVAIAWTLTHTAFTLRYAHLYYREDREGIGGVEFAGALPPTYSDFAYFAFTIGMCFQVSDMTVTSRQIRRAVLAHSVMSFAFNTILLAFVLNLVFGAMS